MRLYQRRKASGAVVWWASWTEGGRTIRRSTRCTTRAAAELVTARWERERIDPVYAASNEATLNSEWVTFIAECRADRLAEGTLLMYRQKAGNLMRLLGAETRLAALDAAMVGGYVNARREEGAVDSTIYKEWITLRGILSSARHRRRFALDPAVLKPPRLVPNYVPRERWLSREEAAKLLGKLSPSRREVVAFVISTGARRKEWNRAIAGDIDRKAWTVHLHGTKTDASDRTIPVPSHFRQYLTAIEPPFRSWGNARRDLAVACKALGMKPVTWNDLRRTFASQLVEDGVAPHIVAKLLGHKSTAMVDRVYNRARMLQLGEQMEAQIRDPRVNQRKRTRKGSDGRKGHQK